MTKIAYLGMGTMGSGMAANLKKAGHDVSAWNRTPKTSPVLQAADLRVTTDLAQALDGAEVVMYCLSDDKAVEDLVFGEHSLLDHVPAGATVIDLSTIDPATSQKEREAFEAKGHDFLDAPVFGTKGEAEGAGLWIVVGGPRAVFDRVLPLFDAISETVHYMGEGGKGAATPTPRTCRISDAPFWIPMPSVVASPVRPTWATSVISFRRSIRW